MKLDRIKEISLYKIFTKANDNDNDNDVNDKIDMHDVLRQVQVEHATAHRVCSIRQFTTSSHHIVCVVTCANFIYVLSMIARGLFMSFGGGGGRRMGLVLDATLFAQAIKPVHVNFAFTYTWHGKQTYSCSLLFGIQFAYPLTDYTLAYLRCLRAIWSVHRLHVETKLSAADYLSIWNDTKNTENEAKENSVCVCSNKCNGWRWRTCGWTLQCHIATFFNDHVGASLIRKVTYIRRHCQERKKRKR